MLFAVSDRVLRGVAASLAAIAILGLWLGFSGGQAGRSTAVRTASQPVPPDEAASQALPIIEPPAQPAAKPEEKTDEEKAAEEKAAADKAAAEKAAAEKAALPKAAANAAAPTVVAPPPPPPAPEEPPPPADEPPPF